MFLKLGCFALGQYVSCETKMHCSLWACSWCFAWVCNCFVFCSFSRKRHMYAVYACINASVMSKRHGLAWLWIRYKQIMPTGASFVILCILRGVVVFYKVQFGCFTDLNNRKHYRLIFPCMLLCSGCRIETNLWHWETDTTTMAAFNLTLN